jgi:ribose transport system substrate-binding protein
MRTMRYKRSLLCVAAITSISALGACGSSSDDSSDTSPASTGTGAAAASTADVKIDVGDGKTITIPAGTKPKIGFFAGAGNAYQSSYQDTVKRLNGAGADITYFDSKFDPATQLKQLQNALQSKDYNAWIVENYGGKINCNILSKQAPAANIVVVQITNPTCDQADKPAGEQFWTPGTLSIVGGEATINYYDHWAKAAKDLFGPGDHVVGVLNGPPLVSSTVNLNKALKDNGIQPVANVAGNYTTPDGLAKAQTMLQAHPDIDVIMSIYGDTTLGGIQAVQQAGKTGKVKIFDVGGSKTVTDQVAAGKQTMSVPYFPVTQAEVAVQNINDAFAGKKVPRYSDAFAKGTVDDPFLITKETAADYDPQY